MKNKSQRGKSPRNFVAEHGEKVYLSIRIKINLPVFRGEKDNSHKLFFFFFFFFFFFKLILIWMFLYHFKSYPYFVFVSIVYNYRVNPNSHKSFIV